MRYTTLTFYTAPVTSFLYALMAVSWMELFSSLGGFDWVTSQEMRQYILTSSGLLVYINFYLNRLSFRIIIIISFINNLIGIGMYLYALYCKDILIAVLATQYIVTLAHIIDAHISDYLIDEEKNQMGDKLSIRLYRSRINMITATTRISVVAVIGLIAPFNALEIVSGLSILIAIFEIIENIIIIRFVKWLPTTTKKK